jgi:hypothetical protein
LTDDGGREEERRGSKEERKGNLKALRTEVRSTEAEGKMDFNFCSAQILYEIGLYDTSKLSEAAEKIKIAMSNRSKNARKWKSKLLYLKGKDPSTSLLGKKNIYIFFRVRVRGKKFTSHVPPPGTKRLATIQNNGSHGTLNEKNDERVCETLGDRSFVCTLLFFVFIFFTEVVFLTLLNFFGIRSCC